MTSKNNDRKFMRIAIDEMQKSRSEHTNKFDPMVGVVIVSSNGIEIDRAHRGSFRVGEHAEYTLIERLLSNRTLENSTLYVTLEPCTIRQQPKIPCVKRIVSARIGRVIIGMSDPNPQIEGHGIVSLLNNNIDVDFFDHDLMDQIRRENKEFIEQWDKVTETIEDPNEKFEGPSEIEKESVSSATLEDLSLKMIQEYLNTRGITYKIPSPELWTFFHKNGFLNIDIKDGSYIPSVAGLLLFGQNPEIFLVQSKLKAESHSVGGVSTEDFTGPILQLPDKIEEFFLKNITTYTEIQGFKRIKVPEYPKEAFREAIINAIVHRDYQEGRRIILQISKKSITIKSPGLPPRPHTLDKIRIYNAPPYSRNPRIADTFNDMNFMEERGWGLRKMRDSLIKHALRPPEFNYESGYFAVTFFGREFEPDVISISSDLLAQLDDRQKKLVNLIIKQGKITSSECVKHFNITRQTANQYFKKLIALGIIEKKGGGPGTFYVLYES